MPAANLLLAMNLPPERAVEYFRTRNLRIGASWQETAQAAHAVAVIAGTYEPAQAMRIAADFAERRNTKKPASRDRYLTLWCRQPG